MPSAASIRGLVQTAAFRHKRLAATNFPRRNTRCPKDSVDRLRIGRIKSEVSSAGVFILVENFLEILSAVGRAKNAAFGVRSVWMAFRGNEHTTRILGIYQDCSDLLGIAQAQVNPSLSGV